jgi:type III pantothenate kinase
VKGIVVVVDAGNTRVKWGKCEGDRVVDMAAFDPADVSGFQRKAKEWNIPPDGLWILAGSNLANAHSLGSWLDGQGKRYYSLKKFVECLPGMRVHEPIKVGADRIYNACAVNFRKMPGEPAIIIDAGSAVTVDLVDGAGFFGGGSIFPGLSLMAKALHDHTEALPVVEVRHYVAPPGDTTESAIVSGVFGAVIGGIEHLVRALTRTWSQPSQVFIGGGDGWLLQQHLPWPSALWPEMTLQGILLAAKKYFAMLNIDECTT